MNILISYAASMLSRSTILNTETIHLRFNNNKNASEPLPMKSGILGITDLGATHSKYDTRVICNTPNHYLEISPDIDTPLRDNLLNKIIYCNLLFRQKITRGALSCARYILLIPNEKTGILLHKEAKCDFEMPRSYFSQENIDAEISGLAYLHTHEQSKAITSTAIGAPVVSDSHRINPQLALYPATKSAPNDWSEEALCSELTANKYFIARNDVLDFFIEEEGAVAASALTYANITEIRAISCDNEAQKRVLSDAIANGVSCYLFFSGMFREIEVAGLQGGRPPLPYHPDQPESGRLPASCVAWRAVSLRAMLRHDVRSSSPLGLRQDFRRHDFTACVTALCIAPTRLFDVLASSLRRHARAHAYPQLSTFASLSMTGTDRLSRSLAENTASLVVIYNEKRKSASAFDWTRKMLGIFIDRDSTAQLKSIFFCGYRPKEKISRSQMAPHHEEPLAHKIAEICDHAEGRANLYMPTFYGAPNRSTDVDRQKSSHVKAQHCANRERLSSPEKHNEEGDVVAPKLFKVEPASLCNEPGENRHTGNQQERIIDSEQYADEGRSETDFIVDYDAARLLWLEENSNAAFDHDKLNSLVAEVLVRARNISELTKGYCGDATPLRNRMARILNGVSIH